MKEAIKYIGVGVLILGLIVLCNVLYYGAIATVVVKIAKIIMGW